MPRVAFPVESLTSQNVGSIPNGVTGGGRGTRRSSLLRQCATSPNIAGSIRSGVTGNQLNEINTGFVRLNKYDLSITNHIFSQLNKGQALLHYS
jgi:hypothetical protein